MSCKRKGVLQLTLDDYHRYADLVEDGLVRAAKFLTRERVFDAGTLPCATQLIPLPTICAVLGDDFEKDAVREKLARIDPYVLPKVAERLHLSPITVGHMLRAGKLPGVKVLRLWRVREAALDAYMRALPEPKTTHTTTQGEDEHARR